MSERVTLKAILKINADCLRAALFGALAWGFWQLHSEGDFIFGVFAALFAFGFVKAVVVAIYGIGKLILKQRAQTQYRAQGAKPKADSLARESDLRQRGLLE